MDWFELVVGEAPSTRGFLLPGGGGASSAAGPAEECQSTQRANLRSYGNKTKSE